MSLTNEQLHAYQFIIDTLKTDNIVLLCGSAGCGKTYLTKKLCEHYLQLQYNIAGIAPTHKAKRVLDQTINKGMIKIPCFTIASILGKMKEHSYIGTQVYSKATNKKLIYNLFILDEISQCSDKDLLFISEFIIKNNKKLIIIGDECQIPCISNGYDIYDDYIEKKNSMVFTCNYIKKVTLTKIVRQSEDSPILTLSLWVRNHIDDDFDIKESNYPHIVSQSQLYKLFIEHFVQYPDSCKMIAYTNQAVKTHNLEARRCLGYTKPYVVNDILTGYQSFGWPELIIENGRDYFIHKITTVTNHFINQYDNLSGTLIDLVIIDNGQNIQNLFFINIYDDQNTIFMNELIKRAEKVNNHYSSKMDYIHYNNLKNKVLFMDDVYKYQDEIYSEHNFKEKHPLLFTKCDDLYQNKIILDNKLTEKIEEEYPTILTKRLKDDKVITESETLADQFKVIEKDIYYGYCLTTHKCQGSTYQCVFVCEHDFKLQNRFNYRYDKFENKMKEKNQLRYVAYTRAQKHLYIID